MKKIGSILLLLTILPAMLFAGEIKVDIIGGNPAEHLETGISRTVYARSLTKGVNLNQQPNLVISLTKIGTALSLDAVLETTPPRAFHRDLKSVDQLSEAIDEMLSTLYQQPAVQQIIPPLPIVPAQVQTAEPAKTEPLRNISLPFKATSIIIKDGRILISSNDIVYALINKKPVKQWTAPRTESIIRMFDYKDALIVVTYSRDKMRSYMVKGDATVIRWDAAVAPFGDGLISARPILRSDFVNSLIRWTKATPVDGQPIVPAQAVDVLSAAALKSTTGATDQLAFIGDFERLEVANDKGSIWTSDMKTGHLPFFIEHELEVSSSENNQMFNSLKPARYFFKSRVIQLGDGSILCIHTTDAVVSLMQYFAKFANNTIMQYKRINGEVETEELVNLGGNYCADFAVKDKDLLYLAVGKSKSQLRFEKLP